MEDYLKDIKNIEDTVIPVSSFVPPGTIVLSEETWSAAKLFIDQTNETRRDSPYILGFVWMLMTRYQMSPDSPMIVEGPTLDIGAYQRWRIPDGVVNSMYGLEYVVLVPPERYVGKKHPVIEIKQDKPRRYEIRDRG